MSSIECKLSFEKWYGMAGLHLEFYFILLLCPSFPINGRIFFRRPNLTIRQLSIALQNRKTTLVVIFFFRKPKSVVCGLIENKSRSAQGECPFYDHLILLLLRFSFCAKIEKHTIFIDICHHCCKKCASMK